MDGLSVLNEEARIQNKNPTVCMGLDSELDSFMEEHPALPDAGALAQDFEQEVFTTFVFEKEL